MIMRLMRFFWWIGHSGTSAVIAAQFGLAMMPLWSRMRCALISGITSGTATVLLKHTSASLVFFENADPTARGDLEEFFRRLVPEEAEYFSHTLEGSDDMPSHIRMALTRTSESIPIMDGSLQLGIWQGLFVYEHRRRPTQRSIAVSVVGDAG